MREERAYPPIYPPGLVKIALADLEAVFADARFSTPLRERLAGSARLFIEYLVRLGVQGEVWIDGSFATRKPDPQDVDVVLMTSEAAVSAMSPTNFTDFEELSAKEHRSYVRARWHVDFYVADSGDSTRRRYFFDLFSRNPDAANRKGIPYVVL